MPILRAATLDEIFALRHAELRPNRPAATACFDGDHAPDTHHFGAFDDSGAAIGCASFMAVPRHGRPAHQLRGMATRADLTRRGIGAALLRHGMAGVVAAHGPRFWWCNARLGAVAFYQAQGWRVASEVLEIFDVGPHVEMECDPAA